MCKVEGWQSLFQWIEHQPLLPNLRVLRIDRNAIAGTATLSKLTVMWAIALLSPSLEIFDLISEDEQQPLPTVCLVVSAILHGILEVCPTIQKLSLFPVRDVEGGTEEHFCLLTVRRIRPLLSYISGLQNLGDLVTSAYVLSTAALQVLGSLPQLRRLTFIMDFTEHLDVPEDLPDNAFPVLEHLALRDLNPDDIRTVLGALPLIRNINSLEIESDLRNWDGSNLQDNNNMAERVLLLLEHAPRLNCLKIDFGSTKYVPFGPRDINKPTISTVLSRLRLHFVHLQGLIFGNTGVLETMFPHMNRLNLQDQPAHMTLAFGYAAIPTLEHLALLITMDNATPVHNTITFQSLCTVEFYPGPTINTPEERALIAEYGLPYHIFFAVSLNYPRAGSGKRQFRGYARSCF